MAVYIDNNNYYNRLTTKNLNINNQIEDFSKDLINKIYKTCGCILISELDIINNTLNEKHIQLCAIHYNQTQPITKIINNELTKSNKNIIINDSYLNFGKYKNKTFNYVFQTDKLYCYNLAFWKSQKYKSININININEFIKYIKNQISINE